MNILLTSVGRRSYIIDYFKSAMSSDDKLIATNSEYTFALTKADTYFVSPTIYDDNYITFLLEVCKKEKVTAIMSLFDIDLPILSQYASTFMAAGVRYIGPDNYSAKICNDKLRTNNFFLQHNINTPITYSNYNNVVEALDSKTLAFPLIIKPRWGMGSIGLYVVKNAHELETCHKKCLADIFSTYLKYESNIDPYAAVVIQEFVDGPEYGIDIYNDLFGNYIAIAAKRKVSMRSGETDIGEVVNPAPFVKFAQSIASQLKFTGIASVDCIVRNSIVYGIEINPRISGHYPFSHLAGIRYPDQLITWLKGGSTMLEKNFTVKAGVVGCKDIVPTIVPHN